MDHDVIVIGAGHNGLTAAAMLARDGRRVLVLERRDRVGGIAAAEEFHPGFRTAGLLQDTSAVRPWVLDELRLERYGLVRSSAPPGVFVPQPDGPGLWLHDAPQAAGDAIAALSRRDAERYAAFRALLGRLRAALEPLLNAPPPDVEDRSPGNLLTLLRQGLRVRRLGQRDLLELLRIAPMCVADWLGEWFETDALKAALAVPAVRGEFVGPWSPGTNALLLLHECTRHGAIAGGAAALVSALEACCHDAGVQVRTGADVRRIEIEHGRVTGVTLADGERVGAGVVLAACSVRHALLELVEPAWLPQRARERVEQFRARGTTAVLHLAIRGEPRLGAPPPAAPALACEFARIVSSIDETERAFDAVKYRQFAERPVLEVYVPTASDPTLAPAGHSVVSVLAHFAPYDLAGGWTPPQRERLQRAIVATLASCAEGLTDQIVGAELLTPVDLERRYGLSGGQLHHGEHGLDQLLVRPTLECARYATPVGGLYLASGGAFPGGGVTCAPGALAARVVSEG